MKGIDQKALEQLAGSILARKPDQAARDFERLITEHWEMNEFKAFLRAIGTLLAQRIEVPED